MNIGIDLDDTISDTAKEFFKYGTKFNEEKGIKFKINQNEWDFDKSFGWKEENIKEFSEKYLEKVFKEVEPKQKAIEKISLLKQQGHKIIIITARSEKYILEIYKLCEEWLLEKNINVDKLIVNARNKAEECRKNDIDIFIDDRNLPL